jgi:RNA polymerase sigma-70 factor (ECF subfamily)
LRLVFLEEKNKDEICRQLNVGREYLRVLIHRAKERFRICYSERVAACGRRP